MAEMLVIAKETRRFSGQCLGLDQVRRRVLAQVTSW